MPPKKSKKKKNFGYISFLEGKGPLQVALNYANDTMEYKKGYSNGLGKGKMMGGQVEALKDQGAIFELRMDPPLYGSSGDTFTYEDPRMLLTQLTKHGVKHGLKSPDIDILFPGGPAHEEEFEYEQ